MVHLSVLFSCGTYEAAGWNVLVQYKQRPNHTVPFMLLKTEKAINLFSVVVFGSLL